MTHTGEERAFLWQGTAVRHHGEGIHLEAIVVVEAQRLMLNDARVKLEAAGLETLAAARMAAVKDGHVVFLGHLVDGSKQAHEVLLCIDVLFAVRAEEDIARRR